MVMCALIPQPGANYIDIADRAYLVMQDLEKDLPEDIDATIAFDNTVFIRRDVYKRQGLGWKGGKRYSFASGGKTELLSLLSDSSEGRNPDFFVSG